MITSPVFAITVVVAMLWLSASIDRSRAAQAKYDELAAKYNTLKINYDNLAAKFLALLKEKENPSASSESGLPNEDISI